MTNNVRPGMGELPDLTRREPNAPDVSEWLKRPYEPSDQAGVLYVWLKSFAHSRYGRVRGAEMTHTPAETRYWAEQAPVVEWLLANATTEVACDPERPEIIWAFACTSAPKTVHYFAVKRSVIEEVDAVFAADMLRDLLGAALGETRGMTHELPWRESGLPMPTRPDGKALWYLDSTWMGRALLARRAA